MGSDRVRGELVRMDDVDPGLDQDGGGLESCSRVIGDDGVCLPEDRGVSDVPVVRVVEAVVVLAIL